MLLTEIKMSIKMTWISFILFMAVFQLNGFCAFENSRRSVEFQVMSDSIDYVKRRMLKLDTTLSKEEIARYLASEISTNAPELLIRDFTLKDLIFKIEDYHFKPSNLFLRKKRHKYPSSMAYTYLCYHSSLNKNKKARSRALKKMNDLIVEAILLTGEGTYSNPFKILSLYEAYYFVKSISNEAHMDAGTFLTKEGKLFAAFKYYNQTLDAIIILYFDISHLKEFTDLENIMME